MKVQGTITVIEKPRHESARFSLYMIIESGRSKLGIQVRAAQRRRYYDLLKENSNISATVRFEHSAREKGDKVFYHNNIILDTIED